MSTEIKWYRVIDPLSPLYGCDVSGWKKNIGSNQMTNDEMLVICAMRRIDIFVGDRPFQLVAPEGETLGLLINVAQLEKSPIQDEIVELATDLPYGEFLEEVIDDRADGLKLHCVAYENAFQIALTQSIPTSSVIVSRIVHNLYDEIVRIRECFNRGDDQDDIKRMIGEAS